MVMAVLSVSGGVIFYLPFLQEAYYKPLADALNLDNAQVGSLLSAFGEVFSSMAILAVFGLLGSGRNVASEQAKVGLKEIVAVLKMPTVWLIATVILTAYCALLEEGGIPIVVTGTAAGIISVVGYTPDIFMPLLGGVLLDRFPGPEGYRLFFLTVAGICTLGLGATVVLIRRVTRKRILN